ncbi:hypothetical protein [uncultured Erythrobacter sp.]|uniref:hypothetical protein n=1 Tax=uncultured Erythrobacter sp. TaxID=263913 RepID=UPI00262AB71A|nr:hypothetical protein [uncultured Erythrobacter sp.]
MVESQPYVERALFIVGEPDSGKSSQLRSMFRDWRFGTEGKIPGARKIQERYWLSDTRAVYLRMTSPHEYYESLDEFLDKTAAKFTAGNRWNFASPLQPYAARKIGNADEVIGAFVKRFRPERVRIVILDPRWSEGSRKRSELQKLVDGFRKIGKNVEVLICDARTKTGNGLIYADFFDFT